MMAACPLCGSSGAKQFPIWYEFRQKKFQAKKCPSCSFVYLDPRPSTGELALLYSDEYFLHDGADCGAHSPTDYESAVRTGSAKFPEILGHIKSFKPSGDFFEIGCGMGYFLDFARKQGYTVSGIEFAKLGAEECRSKFGLNVEQSSLEEYREKPDCYDVIFMGDVLEHLVQPLAMLKKVWKMTKPSGIVAIEVPSMFNTLVGRLAVAGYTLLGVQKRMPMPPYHVNEFTPSTLVSALTRAGFRRATVIQRIKPPGKITLRGSIAERLLKKGLHYPNYGITRTLGFLGDRLLAIGVK
ncbi:MAG: class I SAM-dependent methyltransferase [Bacteroidota bacterium]